MQVTLAQVGVLALLLLGSAVFGVELGRYCAPNAPLAWFPAFFMLPLSFAASMTLWQGLVLLKALVMVARRLLGRRKQESEAPKVSDVEAEERGRQVLRKSAWVMLPAPPVICGLAGVLTGLGATSFLGTLGLFFGAGCAYAALLWLLAQRDLLIFGWEDQP